MELINNDFFNKIDIYENNEILRIIKSDTDNFDLFLLTNIFNTFLGFICNYKLKRIKFSDIDISFDDEKYNDLENDNFMLNDNSLLSYNDYSFVKGKLIKKRVFIKFHIIEKVEIIYFSSLYNFLHYVETIILNYVKPENINSNKISEPEAIDLSDTTATEKIIYLHKLGVIDFLRKQQPFNTSINSLATVLSAVTGEKSGTIQPMLNSMLSKNVGQKNNPLNSEKPVNKVTKQLNDIGFESK